MAPRTVRIYPNIADFRLVVEFLRCYLEIPLVHQSSVEKITMLRHLMLCGLALAAVSASAQAGHHYHFPAYAFAPPVVYATPVVAYQPAYVVPTPYMSVATYPVTTVTYSTQYYAPMVPVTAAYYVPRPAVAPVYGVPVYATPAYAAPGYYGRHGRFRALREVEVEYDRDGEIEIDYR